MERVNGRGVSIHHMSGTEFISAGSGIYFQSNRVNVWTFARFFVSLRSKPLMKQKEHTIIISLASNENQEANMEKAREQLEQLLTEVHFTSAIWTEPIGAIDHSRMYLNQLCKGTTALGDGLLGEVLKHLERRLGRTHNEDGIVAIDLDLLEYDGIRHHLRDWGRSYIKDLINEL